MLLAFPNSFSMSQSHRVSILLPCYNSAATIGLAVQSIISQTLEDFKCYIIDNCSSDETVKIINSLTLNDGRFVLIRNTFNAGDVDSFHRLVEFVDSPYAIYLASHYYWHPECLFKLVAALEANPQAVCAAPVTEMFGEAGQRFFSNGTFPIIAKAAVRRMSLYLNKVTGNSRFYGLYRSTALKDSNILMDFFASDFVMTALTLRHGNHLQVAGKDGGPLLWRKLGANMAKYFPENPSFSESIILLVAPFYGAFFRLYRELPFVDYLRLFPYLLKINFVLSWFVIRTHLSFIAPLRKIYFKYLK